MLNQFKKRTVLLLAFAMMISLLGCSTASSSESVSESVEESEEETDYIEYTVAVKEIKKHGNVVLDTTYQQLQEEGFEIADLITVIIGDESYDMPLGTSFSDVDSGEMVCRYDSEDEEVMLAISNGDFATTTGLATKETIDEDPGYKWTMNIAEVTFILKEKQGYADEYKIRNLERSENREDYPDLTDEEFANFRAMNTTGLKENVLYRSSSPVNPKLGRDTYAMAAMEAAGIKSVLNLTDSADEMAEYETYADSYYSQCAILNVQMGYDYTLEVFDQNIKDCVEFIINNEGPYLIHCTEGKDRTGILCALLEFYGGSSYEEVKNDYMITYANFYGVEEGSETYTTIIGTFFNRSIADCLDGINPQTADLQSAVTDYFKSIGLTEEQLAALSSKICD